MFSSYQIDAPIATTSCIHTGGFPLGSNVLPRPLARICHLTYRQRLPWVRKSHEFIFFQSDTSSMSALKNRSSLRHVVVTGAGMGIGLTGSGRGEGGGGLITLGDTIKITALCHSSSIPSFWPAAWAKDSPTCFAA